jgi:hypothetical protein
MKYFETLSFWDCYRKLPTDTQELADENFKLLRQDSRHPSLHLKKVGRYWSARVGMKYRVLSVSLPRRKNIFSGGGAVMPCRGEQGIYISRRLIN